MKKIAIIALEAGLIYYLSTATGAHVTTIMMKSDKYPLDRGSRDDLQKRPARLEPGGRGGRGRIVIDDDEQITCPRRESILDYFDDDNED